MIYKFLQGVWQRIRLGVIIVLSVIIGISYTIAIPMYQDMRKQADQVWEQHIERINKNTEVGYDGEAGDTVVAPSSTQVSLEAATADQITVASPSNSIEEIIYKYFKDDYEVAKAVFTAESGLQKDAQGWNCHYNGKSAACRPEDRKDAWSVDCGIAQINVAGKTCPQELFNPDENLKVARAKYDARKWQPWCAFQSGAYKKFLASI